jgi:hypothetical protein
MADCQARHRLSRAGNRRIDRVLHIMAIAQLRNQTKGRAYYDKRRAGTMPARRYRNTPRSLDKDHPHNAE